MSTAENQAKNHHVNDYDVLGIGGKRRKERIVLGESPVLRLHPEFVPESRREIYDSICAETVRWLSPSAVEEVAFGAKAKAVLQELLVEDFKNQFPKTHEFLGEEAGRLLLKYNDSLPFQGPLLSDHFRYFSGFLREESTTEDLVVFCQKEWIESYLTFNDFGQEQSDPGILKLNPSLQVLPVRKAGLGLTAGLYVFYADPATKAVNELQVDAQEAEILDLLNEERKFSQAQLLTYIQSEGISRDDSVHWAKKLSNLIGHGIIIGSS